MKMRIHLTLIALFCLSCTPLLHAEDISGKWYVTAEGWNYVMDITQRDDQIYGTCVPESRNRQLDAIVYGEIKGERINFGTHNQKLTVIRKFSGTLIISKNGWAIAGTYTENNRRNIPWHALRY